MTTKPGQSPSQSQLQLAIQTVDGLQLAELANFLGCTIANVRRVSEIQDPKAAILYPILLQNPQSDRLVVIAQLPNQSNALIYANTTIPAITAERTIQALRNNLEIPDRTPEVLAGAKTLYDWMIKPLELELKQASVNTLVFVLKTIVLNNKSGTYTNNNKGNQAFVVEC